jgi:hypothetical protein
MTEQSVWTARRCTQVRDEGRSAVWQAPAKPFTYDLSGDTREWCHDLLGLSLGVPSTASWLAETDRKRFSGMNEIGRSFWACP